MNSFDNFSILFVGDSLHIGNRIFPMGAMATEILNWDRVPLRKLRTRAEEFDSAICAVLKSRDRELIPTAQEKLNAVFDIALTLPPFCYMQIDVGLMRRCLIYAARDDEMWAEAMDGQTYGGEALRLLISKVHELPERLNIFREHVELMLAFYFDALTSRTASEYGKAYGRYCADMIRGGALFFPDLEFKQSFPANVKFVPIRTQQGFAVAEETDFGELHAFLYTDFYRGMIHGHLPRRCQNCGRYFLLTDGYDTRYCSNIAPGETDRTCRKVGAHVKAQNSRDKAAETPEGKEYQTTYNRLKRRKYLGKISTDEWNTQVAEAVSIREKASRGEISEQELKELLASIGGGKRKWKKKSGG